MESTKGLTQQGPNALETDKAQESLLLKLPQDMLLNEVIPRLVQINSGSVKDFDSLISLACTCKQMAEVMRDKKVQKVWEEQKPFLRAYLLPIIKQQKERLEKLARIEMKLQHEGINIPLLKQGVNATNSAGQTALECLLRYIVHGVDLIGQLLECGADVNICDKQGKALVYLMSNDWLNRYELSRMIVTSRTYINKASREQVLRSIIATDSLNSSYYKYLIKNGDYDPNLSKNDDTTLLHFDIEKFGGQNVELLVSKGADVNRCNKNGETPLFPVVKSYGKSSLDVARYLLAHGANPHVINKEGESLLMQARTQEMRELLLAAGVQITPDQATVLVEKAVIKNHNDDELMIFALNHGGQITKEHWKQVINNRGINKYRFDWLVKYESNFDIPLDVLKDELAWADLHRPYANARAADYEIAVGVIQEKIRQAAPAKITQSRNPIKKLWAKFKKRNS